MKFATETIRGVKYEIEVNENGQFACKVDGDWLRAPTLDSLKKKISDAGRAKQRNIKIPFVIWNEGWASEEGKLEHGMCVGIHSGNDNLLVKMGGNPSVEQMNNYRGGKPFDPKHANELERLHKAVKAAQAALENFEEKNGLDLRKMVATLIAKEETS